MTGFDNGSGGFGLIRPAFGYPGLVPGILSQVNMRLAKDPALLEIPPPCKAELTNLIRQRHEHRYIAVKDGISLDFIFRQKKKNTMKPEIQDISRQKISGRQ